MKELFDKEREIREIVEDTYPHFVETQKQMSNSMFIKSLNNIVDDLNKRFINDKITCFKGCSYCCHDEIRMTEFELSNIKDFMLSNRIKPNKKILQKQRSMNFKNLTFLEKKCSLLDSKGECKIYEVRPLVCRMYNSTSSEPKDCINPKNVPTVRSLLIIGLMGALMMLNDKQGREERKLHLEL